MATARNLMLAGATAAAGAYYAPAMYHVYEAESKVTAAERAYDAVNAKAQSHENEIARAQKTVASGLADMTKAQTEATRANEDVAAARAVVADATRALDAKLEAREKIALRLTAVSAEVEKAKGIVAQRTKEKEGTAVQVVKAKIAMDKARKDAMRAAESVTLPPLPFR